MITTCCPISLCSALFKYFRFPVQWILGILCNEALQNDLLLFRPHLCNYSFLPALKLSSMSLSLQRFHSWHKAGITQAKLLETHIQLTCRLKPVLWLDSSHITMATRWRKWATNWLTHRFWGITGNSLGGQLYRTWAYGPWVMLSTTLGNFRITPQKSWVNLYISIPSWHAKDLCSRSFKTSQLVLLFVSSQHLQHEYTLSIYTLLLYSAYPIQWNLDYPKSLIIQTLQLGPCINVYINV